MPSPETPPHLRPTSTTFLTLGRATALGSSSLAALSIGFGIASEVTGGLHFALAVAVPAVVFALLGGLWHAVLGYAAHAEHPHERALAAGGGTLLALVGLGCSGWFLASLLGGEAALLDYRNAYLGRLRATGAIVAQNHKLENNVLGAVASAASNFGALAESEARVGAVSGRPGKGAVYSELSAAAASLEEKSDALLRVQGQRDTAFARFRDDLGRAVTAASKRDKPAFENMVEKAGGELSTAYSIHLDVADVGVGVNMKVARAQIMAVIKEIAAVKADTNNNLQELEIPAYVPLDAKRAIIEVAQPFAWITACAVEFLPLLFLGVLLTFWRRNPPEGLAPASPNHSAAPQSPALIPAE